MEFKIEITKNYIEVNGTTSEILAGLAMLISRLKENNIPEKLIRKTVDLGLNIKQKAKVETVLDSGKCKIQKFDLNGLSKEEAKEFITKELFKTIFD